ncbi:MAG: o-succinylbenzoate synthase [Lentimicrobium sp.]|nr:o-succinylbenzoate synthase [Lentimicrobium sp.]
MLKATYHRHTLFFRKPAGTSRGVLLHRNAYFLLIADNGIDPVYGIGECGTIPGLSFDDKPDYESAIELLCRELNRGNTIKKQWLENWPSIAFAFETALLDLKQGGNKLLFNTTFSTGQKPLPINGLIWMGNPDEMLQQIDEKIASGFSVIKIKVGAIDFNEELNLIRHIRSHFPEKQITIRLDANGAFETTDAIKKIEKLSAFSIHSIEQPIKAGNIKAMADLCRNSAIPIALDEELIGITNPATREKLIETILPQYIILKPTLLGGFENSEAWIRHAETYGAGWWITSALESNIGLNAIAQWTATLNNPLPQGLGTGSLYTNNIPSPLKVEDGFLHYKPEQPWDLSLTGIKKIN